MTFDIKRGVYYVLGIFILSVGVSLVVSASLGAGPWDLLSVTLGNRFSISVGTCLTIIQVTLLVLTMIIFKERLEILSVIPAVLQGLFMNVLLVIFARFTINPFILITVGSFVTAVGLSIYAFQGLSANPIDNFTMAIHRNSKMSVSKAKVISDLVPLVIVVIFGSIPHFTTIIVYLLVPFFLEIIIKSGITNTFKQE